MGDAVKTKSDTKFEAAMLSKRGRLRSYAISLARKLDKADDLVQDTMLSAWEHRKRFKPGTNLDAWLFVILRNTFLSGLRKDRRIVPDLDDRLALNMATEPHVMWRLELERIDDLMNAMPPDMRDAVLAIAMGDSYQEHAEAAHIAVGTVKSRVSRGREKLGVLVDV